MGQRSKVFQGYFLDTRYDGEEATIDTILKIAVIYQVIAISETQEIKLIYNVKKKELEWHILPVGWVGYMVNRTFKGGKQCIMRELRTFMNG